MDNVLFPFQRKGRDFLSPSRGALLADQPGLGKTAQAIAAADDSAAQRIVVCCPASLKTNWRREIARFSWMGGSVSVPTTKDLLPVTGGPRWTIVNYDIARLPALMYQLARIKPDLLICDEMHRTKGGPDTAIGRAFFDVISPACGGMWGLSGTPAPNHIGELFWWIQATCPQAFRDTPDYYRFLAKYTVYRDTPYGIRVSRNKNTLEFLERIAPYFLRRMVRDVMPELPALQMVQVVLDPSGPGVAAAVRELSSHPEYRALAAMAKEIATGELQLSADKYAKARRLTGVLKVKPYAELVVEELTADPEKKLVIMAWHTEVIAALASALSAFNPVTVTGATSQTSRQKAVDDFQDATQCSRVFIGQIIAAGEGLTLTAAYQVDIFESNWVPKDIEQALRRVLRIGQKSQKCVGRFISLGDSIDEIIDANLQKKTRLLAEVFDQPTGEMRHEN